MSLRRFEFKKRLEYIDKYIILIKIYQINLAFQWEHVKTMAFQFNSTISLGAENLFPMDKNNLSSNATQEVDNKLLHDILKLL